MELIGGLGNQLFQWQAAMIAGSLMGEKVCVDSRKIRSARDRFGILNFNMPSRNQVVYEFGVRSLLTLMSPQIRKQHATLSFRTNPKKLHQIRDLNHPSPSELILQIESGNKEIEGYFQSAALAEYFRDNHFDFSKMKFITRPPDLYSEIRSDILKFDPVVIHARRGDYLTSPDVWGVLSIDYYLKALTTLNNCNESRIFIFSDSINLVKEEFKILEKDFDVRFVQTSPELTAAHVLKLMSFSSRQVISNSTFSWWSAFFSGSSDVVAPSKFYKGIPDHSERYPSHWKLCNPQWVIN